MFFRATLLLLFFFLWRSVWNPQYFALLLLHDGHDLSANVGDAASLDHAWKTRRVGGGCLHRESVLEFHIWMNHHHWHQYSYTFKEAHFLTV